MQGFQDNIVHGDCGGAAGARPVGLRRMITIAIIGGGMPSL